MGFEEGDELPEAETAEPCRLSVLNGGESTGSADNGLQRPWRATVSLPSVIATGTDSDVITAATAGTHDAGGADIQVMLSQQPLLAHRVVMTPSLWPAMAAWG